MTPSYEILAGGHTKLPFSVNALRVLAGRYLQRDENGDVCETPEGMFDRVAKATAAVEADYGTTDQEIKTTEAEFVCVCRQM